MGGDWTVLGCYGCSGIGGFSSRLIVMRLPLTPQNGEKGNSMGLILDARGQSLWGL